MTQDQATILAVLAGLVALLAWGRARHDVVAVGALMACVVAGLVPLDGAFAGFGHPAVVTVACVLVLSRGLQTSGAVDAAARLLLPARAGRLPTLAALTGLGAVLSGFMNNVGAMALLMPVAVQAAARLGLPAGRMLMPLAFATVLGGMTTLIGTPPNLIVSGFREGAGAGGFRMFDFAWVGVPTAAAGVAFLALAGWRLVPSRRAPAEDGFDAGAYMTETRVPAGSRAVGMSLREIEEELADADAQVVGLVRGEVSTVAPRGGRRVREGDVLVMEAEAAALSGVLSRLGLRLEEQASGAEHARAGAGPPAPPPPEVAPAEGADAPREDVVLREYVVRPGAAVAGRSARDLMLRSRYGINLLALSRKGRRSSERLRSVRLLPGDVVLLQGPADVLAAFAQEGGCLPLAPRELAIPDRRLALLSAGILAASVAAAAAGLLPAAHAFALGALASVLAGTVPARQLYQAVDWPVVVLLAALLPVAGALESTGAAGLAASALTGGVAGGDVVVALALVLVVTMTLSDVLNNAATAAVMCPVAIGVAQGLGAAPDPFLMAVAIGASCAFLTPIGHQNNTLVLGPGGFRFGDYWRAGLPLEALVVAVSLPLLLLAWPP